MFVKENPDRKAQYQIDQNYFALPLFSRIGRIIRKKKKEIGTGSLVETV